MQEFKSNSDNGEKIHRFDRVGQWSRPKNPLVPSEKQRQRDKMNYETSKIYRNKIERVRRVYKRPARTTRESERE